MALGVLAQSIVDAAALERTQSAFAIAQLQATIDRVELKVAELITLSRTSVETLAQAVVDAVATDRTQATLAIALLRNLDVLIQAGKSVEDLAAIQKASADLVVDTAAFAEAVVP